MKISVFDKQLIKLPLLVLAIVCPTRRARTVPEPIARAVLGDLRLRLLRPVVVRRIVDVVGGGLLVVELHGGVSVADCFHRDHAQDGVARANRVGGGLNVEALLPSEFGL